MENRQKMFINAEALLKYLTGNDQLHTLITTQNNMVELVTTDQSIYEALGSVENRNDIDLNLLVKFLEVTKIMSYADSTKETRKILTPERAEEIRSKIKNE